MAYHHGNLREALIEAAVRLLRDHAPDDVSVRKVARAAGVSSGAPFRHFADKVELMAAVADDGLERLNAEILRMTSAAPDNAAEKFRAIGVAYVQFAVRYPGHFRVMHRPEYTSAGARSHWEAQRTHMRALIVAGQEAGTVRDGDPEVMLMTAQALVYGVARMFVDGLFAAEGVSDEEATNIADLVTAQLGVGLVGDAGR